MTPPIDKAALEAAIASYSLLSTQAADGSKKAIAARNHQGDILIKMLRQLGHWVEANCNDDLKTFLASGFHAKSATSNKRQPVSESIRKLRPGKNSGEMEVVPVALPEALAYQLRFAPASGGTPANWTIQPVGLTRPPTVVTGLAPRTSYVFQVRAVTRSGYTDWSDPITRICV